MNDKVISQILLGHSMGTLRIVVALFVLSSAVMKLLYDKYLPNLIDFNEIRWAIVALGCVFLLATFIKYKSSILNTYLSFFLYLLTVFYALAFTLVNHFNPSAVTILILIIGASTVIINNLTYYGVQSGLIILASVIVFQGIEISNENTVAFFNLIIANGAFAIVILVRLKLISSVKHSHANLEKLQVLSIIANKNGEIVFISPSAYSLLGYESKELMKSGWWNIAELSKGWISQEHILNYPNIIPNELLTMECQVIAKDGTVKWLNWINSILPNGNYMGIAVDITKYKV